VKGITLPFSLMNPFKLHLSILLLLLPFLAIVSNAKAQTVAQLDADNGFMGIPLGKPDSTVRYLIPSGRSQKLNKSRLPNDKLTYQGIPLVSVMVYSFRDRIHSIDVKTTGPSTEMLLKRFKERYGAGGTEQVRDFTLSWRGEKVYLSYEKSYMSEEGKFSFVSFEVHKDYLKYMEDLKYGK
jgi:hypothetical protein